MKNIFLLYVTLFFHTTTFLSATGIVVKQVCQNIEYSINDELKTQAYDPYWYETISKELGRLVYVFGNNGHISFAKLPVQQQAPTLYKFLKQKIDTVIKQAHVPIPTLTICIKPFDQSKPEHAYNAHAQTCIQKQICCRQLVRSDGKVLKTSVKEKTTAFHDIVFNEETIRLIAWHEGTDKLPLKEGIFDGIIAHELAHIVCNHDGSTIQNELEADSMGSTFINNRSYVFDASTMLLAAGALYGMLLENKTKCSFGQKDLLQVTQIIISSLTKQVAHLGFISDSPTHVDVYTRIAHSLHKAYERIQTTHSGASAGIHLSLIYDELKEICQSRTFTSNVQITCTCQGPMTHPAPCLRKKCVLARLDQ